MNRVQIARAKAEFLNSLLRMTAPYTKDDEQDLVAGALILDSMALQVNHAWLEVKDEWLEAWEAVQSGTNRLYVEKRDKNIVWGSKEFYALSAELIDQHRDKMRELLK